MHVVITIPLFVDPSEIPTGRRGKIEVSPSNRIKIHSNLGLEVGILLIVGRHGTRQMPNPANFLTSTKLPPI